MPVVPLLGMGDKLKLTDLLSVLEKHQDPAKGGVKEVVSVGKVKRDIKRIAKHVVS
jgi:hypothetical protein